MLSNLERQSICELELDCTNESIINPDMDKGQSIDSYLYSFFNVITGGFFICFYVMPCLQMVLC